MHHRYLDHVYELAGRRIDPVAGVIHWQGDVGVLRRKQLEVLALLAGADGEQVCQEEFIEHVWDGNKPVGERGLRNTIYELRRSLKDKDSEEPLIRTIPRRGYQLTVEARLLDDQTASFAASWRVPGKAGWRLEQLVSRSEFAETWLAKQEAGSRRSWLRFCRNEQHLRRLRREVTVLRFLREKLGGQGNIASIIDWQLDEPPYFLEMEPTVHGNLVDWAASRGGLDRIPVAERLRILSQAAQALATVHGLDVVHRNISPASVLVDEQQGQVCGKLGEFALGDVADREQLAAADITAAGLTFSSGGIDHESAYPAPKISAELEPGSASDVYAFGVVLYQALAGAWGRGFEEDWRESIESSELQEIIAACVAELAEDRPSARQLSRYLQDFLAGRPEAARSPRDSPGPAPLEAATIKPMRAGSGQSIGPYRLLEVLGEGGMGTVYLAEQRRPVERKVALKLVKAGMDGEQVLARFEAERQALALMDHDNVAAVFDAGSAESGHPYFVMEYVPGLDITEHCDRARTGLRGRIELFLQVCDGVQHAHQKGLIHRDLKPSNILVKRHSGEDFTVKIIDFGVAKSLQRKLSERTVYTRLGTFVGTPRYSSPEQISHQWPAVDTRSDVYSLGVVLYELVTGVTPHSTDELAGKSSAELAKILEADPPAPRSRFLQLDPPQKEEIARNRSRSIAELEQRLHADLSWILLKSLDPDPDERYPSVAEFRKDLRRWLEDRPVEARPATRAYRLRKLAKRHRTAFTLTALAALALLTATTVAVFGFVRAEREAAKARAAALEAEKAAEFQVKQLQSIDPSAMASGLRSQVLSRFREKLSEKGLGDRAALEAEQQLDQSLAEVNLVDLTLDLLDGHFFEPAIEVVDQDYADFPELQARLWQSIADTLLELGDATRAAKPQRLALERRQSVLGPEHPLTLESMHHSGNMKKSLGQLDQSRADLEAAVHGLRQQLGEDDEKTLAARQDLGSMLLHLYEWQEARGHFTDVLAARRRLLGNDHPDTLTAIGYLAILGYWTDELEEAERYFDEALAGMRRVLGEKDPLTLAMMAQGSAIYARQGRPDRAITVMQKAIDGMRERLGEDHPQTRTAINDLAVLLANIKDYERAESYFRQALESQRRSVGLDNTGTMTTMGSLGRLLAVTGRLDEAEDLLQQAVSVFRRVFGIEHRRTRFYLYHLGMLYRDRGRLQAAEAAFRELASFEHGEDTREQGEALQASSELARVLLLMGRSGESETLQRQTLESQRQLLGAQHSESLQAQSYLAEVFMHQGQLARAETLLRQTLARQREDPGLEDEETLFTMRLLCDVLREQGRLEPALALGEEAARVGSNFFHADDHRLAWLKLSYGQTLAALGRSKEAEPILLDARRRLEKAGLGACCA